MCCKRCIYFEDCKKAKKNNSDCCINCPEYDICPLVFSSSPTRNYDSPVNTESDLEIFQEDGF